MTNRRANWAESIAKVFESWGIVLRPAALAPLPATVRVYLSLETGERVHVGTLANEAREYVFRYEDTYAERSDCPPIATFPEKRREYRSSELWPFFHVRLPPLGRQDVKQFLRQRNIDEADTFQLLGTLGARAVTTPFELSYEST